MIDEIDDGFNKQQYEAHLQDYLDLNKDAHVGGGTAQTRVELVKEYLSAGSRVFEIGSGGGTDALALQEAGYTVMASDFSEKFVEVLKSKELPAMYFDAKLDTIPEAYDAVYANAVFVHFSPAEFESFLRRAKDALVGDRIIYFSVIQGEGKERRAVNSGLERDFQYYSQDQLKQILLQNDYEVLAMRLVDDRWIQAIAQAVK